MKLFRIGVIFPNKNPMVVVDAICLNVSDIPFCCSFRVLLRPPRNRQYVYSCMESVTYSTNEFPSRAEVLALYADAGWTGYTQVPDKLIEGLQNSLYLACARENDLLLGLVRVVGDGSTIAYIQDILVKKSHQRLGIGRRLMQMVLEEYKDVRQKVLITDDNPQSRGFYESIGFRACGSDGVVAYVMLGTPSTD